MGRRPNALIGEFFRRGRKLNDSSNRYEHQCTKCGELFPKGRIDGMLTHLVKRCPNMTQETRDLVFQHMHGNASASSNTGLSIQAQRNGQGDATGIQNVEGSQHDMSQIAQPQQQMHFQIPADPQQGMHGDMQQQMQPSMQYDLLLQREQSALDTLAEVSRRHLDISELRNMPHLGPQVAMMMPGPEQDFMEQALFHAIQRQPADHTSGNATDNHSTMPTFPGFDQPASQGANNYMLPANIASLPLVQAATAANQELEQSQMQQPQHDHNSSIDPQLAGHSNIDTTHLPPDSGSGQPDFMAWTDTPQNFVTLQSPPTNQPAPGFNSLQVAQRNNARARFTDNRRKQVQEIRKQGACIRCRMLKKPCSEGTPCKTCQQVDTARLWKGACLRTRIAEECTLFSTSYFHSLAKAEEDSVTAQRPLHERMPGGIEVKLSSQSDLAIVFAAKRYVAPDSKSGGIDTASNPGINAVQEIALLDEGEGMSQKMSKLCSSDSTTSESIESEANVFLKATLQEAASLLTSEAATEMSQAQKANIRANHISPSQLLKQVMELWVETNLLASSNSAGTISIQYKPSADLMQPAAPIDQSDSSPATPILIPQTSRTYHRIKSQLLAATETRCHRLSKTVLNELERRLLQRQQVSAFATFIAAVILLNCVERMTAFYASINTTHLPPTVQLEQSARFASLLTTLLRMRALPPTTTRTDDGKLAVVQALALSVRLNGVASKDAAQAEEAARRAAAWLDPLHLDVESLIKTRDGAGGGQEAEGWRSWDGRFVAGVVLPEGV